MKILFIDKVHPSLKNDLEENNYICDESYNLSKKEIEKKIYQYNGIIIRSRFIIDSKFIEKAKNLKFIARAGSGLENIDIEFAESKKIVCFNASEGNRQAVAEHAIAMILSLFNNLNRADNEIRKGKWFRESNRGIEISGKTIALIGYGNNGSAFANVLKGFGVKILAYDKYLDNYDFQSKMKEIYKQSDIVSLHIPLTEETKHLVNDKFIDRFSKDFYLINTSRGKCVNTKSLVKALKKGKIKGVCLDVLEYEKTSFEELSSIGLNSDMKYIIHSKKTILSPHIAGWTIESNIKIANVLRKKILEINL
tara:strand:- start:698 stop:1624 length:927 start_codon:yes stop_codon:yes gene_type:complete